jgi:hypothetical protein
MSIINGHYARITGDTEEARWHAGVSQGEVVLVTSEVMGGTGPHHAIRDLRGTHWNMPVTAMEYEPFPDGTRLIVTERRPSGTPYDEGTEVETVRAGSTYYRVREPGAETTWFVDHQYLRLPDDAPRPRFVQTLDESEAASPFIPDMVPAAEVVILRAELESLRAERDRYAPEIERQRAEYQAYRERVQTERERLSDYAIQAARSNAMCEQYEELVRKVNRENTIITLQERERIFRATRSLLVQVRVTQTGTATITGISDSPDEDEVDWDDITIHDVRRAADEATIYDVSWDTDEAEDFDYEEAES